MFFYYFVQKSLFTENYFQIAAINVATRGLLYTCLVLYFFSLILTFHNKSIKFFPHLSLKNLFWLSSPQILFWISPSFLEFLKFGLIEI